jgi:hypothetical protein
MTRLVFQFCTIFEKKLHPRQGEQKKHVWRQHAENKYLLQFQKRSGKEYSRVLAKNLHN